MKKLLAAVLCLAMILSLAACSNSEGGTSASKTGPSAASAASKSTDNGKKPEETKTSASDKKNGGQDSKAEKDGEAVSPVRILSNDLLFCFPVGDSKNCGYVTDTDGNVKLNCTDYNTKYIVYKDYLLDNTNKTTKIYDGSFNLVFDTEKEGGFIASADELLDDDLIIVRRAEEAADGKTVRTDYCYDLKTGECMPNPDGILSFSGEWRYCAKGSTSTAPVTALVLSR